MPELDERIAVLETNQQFMRERIDEMSKNVSEMHALMMQAKGAKWAILGVASLAGFLSGKAAALFAAFGFKM